MGQAKRRGTFEQRLAQALERKPPELPFQPIEKPPNDEELWRRRTNRTPVNMQMLAALCGLLSLSSMGAICKRKGKI